MGIDKGDVLALDDHVGDLFLAAAGRPYEQWSKAFIQTYPSLPGFADAYITAANGTRSYQIWVRKDILSVAELPLIEAPFRKPLIVTAKQATEVWQSRYAFLAKSKGSVKVNMNPTNDTRLAALHLPASKLVRVVIERADGVPGVDALLLKSAGQVLVWFSR